MASDSRAHLAGRSSCKICEISLTTSLSSRSSAFTASVSIVRQLGQALAQTNVIETPLKLTSCLCNIELHVVQLCANDLRMGKEGLYGESQE